MVALVCKGCDFKFLDNFSENDKFRRFVSLGPYYVPMISRDLEFAPRIYLEDVARGLKNFWVT